MNDRSKTSMSPRTAHQNQTLRNDSKVKILTAALDLFAKIGYEQTSVRMIAQSAEVAQGLLYNYFESKEHVLRAIFVQSLGDVQESFAAGASEGSPQQQLEQLIRASFEIVQRHLHFWKLFYSIRFQPAVLVGLDSEIQEWSDSIRTVLQQHFAELGAADPEVEAALLFGLIDGVAQHYALDPERYPLEAVVAAIVAQYCR